MKLLLLTVALSLGLLAQGTTQAPPQDDKTETLQPMPKLPVENPTDAQIEDVLGFTRSFCIAAMQSDDVPTPEVITDCNTAFAKITAAYPKFKVGSLDGGAKMDEKDALESFRVIAIEYSSVALHNLQKAVLKAREAGDTAAAIHFQNMGNRVFVIDDILSQVTGTKIVPVEVEEEDAAPKKDVRPDNTKPQA